MKEYSIHFKTGNIAVVPEWVINELLNSSIKHKVIRDSDFKVVLLCTFDDIEFISCNAHEAIKTYNIQHTL